MERMILIPTYNDGIFQVIAERFGTQPLDTSSYAELIYSAPYTPYTIIIDEESDIETCEIQISEDELMAFLEQK